MKRLFTVGGNDRALPSKSNEFRVLLILHKRIIVNEYFHTTANSKELNLKFQIPNLKSFTTVSVSKKIIHYPL